VEGGLAPSLAAARAFIMEGRAYQDEVRLNKPSDAVKDGARLSVREGRPYVSRGAHKLLGALEAFGLETEGKICLDVGASTGGFTDVMLRRGAARVYAVDVGYGLLDWQLRRDPRVVVMERTNARFLTPEMFPDPPEFGATDVSFISLKQVLPAALRALGGDWRFVALIKPQFEAPRNQVGPRGVVRDPAVHREVIARVADCVASLGCRAAALDYSPITGPEGNVEFLLSIDRRNHLAPGVDGARIGAVVSAAYDKFMKSPDSP